MLKSKLADDATAEITELKIKYLTEAAPPDFDDAMYTLQRDVRQAKMIA